MMRDARLTASALVALACLVLLTGCSESAETRRKQAQSTGDKYFEFLKAGNPQGAYDNTFSSQYKRELSFEPFARFTERWLRGGQIDSYTVVRYDADPTKKFVVLSYAVQVVGIPVPLMFDLQLVQEASDWRIQSIEPKAQQPGQTGPPSAPAPGVAPAPGAAPPKR